MAEIRRIVCLANSRKVSGRCLAGKEVESGRWLRPVSARPAGEISEEERRYEDGTSAQVLDLIDIPIIGPTVSGHQMENYLIDPEAYWTRVGSMPRSGLPGFLDHPESLWKNGDSSMNGRNDRVRIDAATEHAGSLYLIVPEFPTIHVVREGVGVITLRRRVRAFFSYRGTRYNLVVTDPIVEKAFLAKRDGEYPVDLSAICVSLSEPYNDGYSYKLAAALIGK